MNTNQLYAVIAEKVDNAICPNFGTVQAAHVFGVVRSLLFNAVESGEGTEVINLLVRQMELEREIRAAKP